MVGISINQGARPIVTRNRVRDGQGVGIFVAGRGSGGALEGNTVTGNNGFGIEVSAGADPLLKNNSILDGRGGGVLISGAGTRGSLEGNTVEGNVDGALWIEGRGADPLVTGCSFRGGFDAPSVVVKGRGTLGRLEGNRVFAGAEVGSSLWIEGRASPDIRSSNVIDPRGVHRSV